MLQSVNNAQWVGECLLKAILMEACSWPKPGLVTPLSNGAHDDMDIWLFITSSSVISPCFTACAKAGETHEGSLSELFNAIRKIGIQYENKLLEVTQHINTQRGILFAGSILATAAGWLYRQGRTLSYASLSQCVTELCRDLCLNDFAALAHRSPQTQGERLFVEFGVIGIRGETEQGFPLVCNIGLPALHQAISQGLGWRECLIHTLLTLMANCDDTTVLSRGNWKALDEMKRRAQELVKLGGMFHPDIEQALTDFNKWCMKKWISPGGSADLLALCLAMYFLCNQTDKKSLKERE